VLLSIVLPILGALILTVLVARTLRIDTNDQGQISVVLAGIALASWYVGWRWYGLPELGLRAGRPLYAGIGFATLGWIAFLLVRFFTVEVSAYDAEDAGRSFVFILLFEAFCVQIWTYGFFFRAVVDWRGPLTAAVASGVLFAAAALFFFQEQVIASSFLFFTVWGVFYGIIRLRTGSFLGAAIIQALQSWTAWQVMVPDSPVDSTELRNLYLVTSALYILFIWRLWPKKEEDYRV
jgi:hypothetical protein